jgi:hypothetical protein
VIRTSDDQKMPPAFWAKLGWDSQVNEDLRVRLTGSIYNAAGYDNGFRIYGGDRAGARYYKVFDFVDTAATPDKTFTNDFSGRINPNLRKLTAFQINPFVKWQGLEFFGVFEVATGFAAGAQDEEGDWEKGNYTQLGAELLYRFGKEERFYVGGRFNSVTGNDSYRKTTTAPDEKTVNRINVGGGWFMTKNVLAKVEYVTQTYNDAWTSPSGNLTNGNFNGFMLEAVIGF